MSFAGSGSNDVIAVKRGALMCTFSLAALFRKIFSGREGGSQQVDGYVKAHGIKLWLSSCRRVTDRTLVHFDIENIFVFQSYCVNKFNVDRQEFNRNFGISEDMDTLP